jgi:ribosome-binding factor A
MPPRRVSRKHLTQGCSEPGPGDGLDPRLDRPDGPGNGVGGRKTLQLCGQIARALSALLGNVGDETLRDLTVHSVTPAAGKGRLLVTLTPAPSAAPCSQAEWLAAIGRFAPLARREAAAAIHRRKVPDLVFRLQS